MKIKGCQKPLGRFRNAFNLARRAGVGVSRRPHRTSPKNISICPANEAVFKFYPLFPSLVVWPLHHEPHGWQANYVLRHPRAPFGGSDGPGDSPARARLRSAIKATRTVTYPFQPLAGFPPVDRRGATRGQLRPRQPICPGGDGVMSSRGSLHSAGHQRFAHHDYQSGILLANPGQRRRLERL